VSFWRKKYEVQLEYRTWAIIAGVIVIGFVIALAI